MKFGQPPQKINTINPNINVNAWNFGLGNNFESEVEIHPRIENFIMDLTFF